MSNVVDEAIIFLTTSIIKEAITMEQARACLKAVTETAANYENFEFKKATEIIAELEDYNKKISEKIYYGVK
jgi:hypothetical protein